MRYHFSNEFLKRFRCRSNNKLWYICFVKLWNHGVRKKDVTICSEHVIIGCVHISNNYKNTKATYITVCEARAKYTSNPNL